MNYHEKNSGHKNYQKKKKKPKFPNLMKILEINPVSKSLTIPKTAINWYNKHLVFF